MRTDGFGIPQLLKAENIAKERIGEARRAKVKKLKAAKEEAKYEIEQLLKNSEQAYKDRENNILGSKNDMKERQNQQVQKEQENISAQTEGNKEMVIARVIQLVCNVEPKLHINYCI